jgi:uncharacterized membrane protein
MLNPKIIGAIVGLIFGVIVIWFGFLKAFLLALCILVGWLVGKFWMGEIDLLALYERFMNSRGRRRR